MLLKDLYYLTQIARHGSLSLTAKQLGITQSALSHAVCRLEKEFSTSLLLRQNDGVVLTPAGRITVTEAQNILDHCQSLKNTFNASPHTNQNHLNIGIVTLHENYIIPMLARYYSDYFPQTSISFISNHSNELEEKTRSGSLDFSIIPLPVHSSNLVCKELFSEEILLGLPAFHPLTKVFRSDGLTSKDLMLLKNETFIITKKTGKFASICLEICNSLFSPENLIEIHSLDTLCTLIAKNTGIGFIPAMLAHSKLLSEKIICYHLKDFQAQQTFVIVTNPARTMTPIIHKFIDLTCRLFQDISY